MLYRLFCMVLTIDTASQQGVNPIQEVKVLSQGFSGTDADYDADDGDDDDDDDDYDGDDGLLTPLTAANLLTWSTRPSTRTIN